MARAFELNAHEVVWNWHSSMGWIYRDIKRSIVLLMRIVYNKFLTGSDKTQKATHQLPKKKSTITARVNFKLQSVGAGQIRSFFATGTKSSNKKVPAKKGRICKHREYPSNEQCRIGMNESRTVHLN
jgi:hypothetical protein